MGKGAGRFKPFWHHEELEVVDGSAWVRIGWVMSKSSIDYIVVLTT
jgi:hypothetical protein